MRGDADATGLIADLTRARDDAGEPLSDQELLDNLHLLVLAGHETTASVLAWSIAHTFIDPTLRTALADEVAATAGLPGTPDEMKAFPLTEGIFREALRLHPPVPIHSRRLTESVRISDIDVPAGTTVNLSLRTLSRDPTAFPDPDTFDPRRWADRKLGPLEKLPFGAGPHFCLGYHMALVEGMQFIIALTRALSARGRTLEMTRGVPRERHLGICWPRAADTHCRIVPA